MYTPQSQAKLASLVALCHKLGAENREWAILGEGNASINSDEGTFFVKASGARLATLTDQSIVQLSTAPLLEVLESDSQLMDSQVSALLKLSIVQETELSPSVDSLIHAYLLSLEGITAVGHTHVLSINALLCSIGGWAALQSGGRLFPDEVVVCGPASCTVPYTDPGLPLARAVRDAVRAYRDARGIVPKTIYIQNHGFIALGHTTDEVVAITAMAEKAAKIMLGAFASGGPKFLNPDEVARIATRLDEKYRQKALGLTTD